MTKVAQGAEGHCSSLQPTDHSIHDHMQWAVPLTLYALLCSAENPNLEPPLISFCKKTSHPIRKPGPALLKEKSPDPLHQNKMGGYCERYSFLHSILDLLSYDHQRKMPDYYTLENVRVTDLGSQIVFNNFS